MVCALAIEVLRRKSDGVRSNLSADYYSFWTILLYTVALKSLLQALETLGHADKTDLIYYLTLGVVVSGIVAAALVGRRLLLNLNDLRSKHSRVEIAALFALLFAYLGLVFFPIYFL